MQAAQTVPQFTQTAQNTAGAAASAANESSEKSDSALQAADFQTFLTLLTAQLRNQDPLNPADSTEFVAQLAQFSSVEQLVNVNSKLDSIASAMVADGIETYAGWVGKKAEAISAPGYFDGADPVEFRISGYSEARRVEIVITDAAGKETTRFNALNGQMVQQWDGMVDGEPATPGAYAITAEYFDEGGGLIAEEVANTFGGVREIRLNGGAPSIVLEGGIDLSPDQVAGLGLQD